MEEQSYKYQAIEDEKESGSNSHDNYNEESEENEDFGPTTKFGLCWFKFVTCFDYFRKGKKKIGDESFEGEEEEEELSREKSKQLIETITIACLLLITIVLAGMALIYLEFVLVPLVLAWFLVYLFQPFINFLVGKKAILHDKIRIRLPRLIAVAIVAFVVILIIGVLAIAIYYSVIGIVNDSDKYLERISEIKQDLINWAEEYGLGDEIENLIPRINVGDIFLAFVAEAMVFVPQAILCILFTIYMLVDYDETKEKTTLQRSIDKQIRKYILIKVLLSIATTALIAITYASLSLDMWILFSLLTFLLNFIPNVGCMIAIVLPLPIVLLDPNQTWWSATLIFLIPSLIHFFAGNFLEPKVMGKSFDMSAISVLVSLTFWGSVWGIVGTFISVPLTVVIFLWLKTIPHPMAKFFANMISGKIQIVEAEKKNN